MLRPNFSLALAARAVLRRSRHVRYVRGRISSKSERGRVNEGAAADACVWVASGRWWRTCREGLFAASQPRGPVRPAAVCWTSPEPLKQARDPVSILERSAGFSEHTGIHLPWPTSFFHVHTTDETIQQNTWSALLLGRASRQRSQDELHIRFRSKQTPQA